MKNEIILVLSLNEMKNSSVASSVHFYRLEATNLSHPEESYMSVKRMVVLK